MKMMVPSSSEPCLMGSGTKNMHVNLVDQQRTPGVFWVFGCILEMYTVQMYFIQQIYYIHTHLLFHGIYIYIPEYIQGQLYLNSLMTCLPPAGLVVDKDRMAMRQRSWSEIPMVCDNMSRFIKQQLLGFV